MELFFFFFNVCKDKSKILWSLGAFKMSGSILLRALVFPAQQA